jgi:hypothetical protein
MMVMVDRIGVCFIEMRVMMAVASFFHTIPTHLPTISHYLDIFVSLK